MLFYDRTMFDELYKSLKDMVDSTGLAHHSAFSQASNWVTIQEHVGRLTGSEMLARSMLDWMSLLPRKTLERSLDNKVKFTS